MDNRIIYGIYDDDEVLLDAVKKLREKGVKIREVFAPFPVHGLDKALGIKPTRLSIAAFIYGVIGLFLALLMMWYMLIQDWPVNIGGKPNFSLGENLPSFIPVAFEITVLCAAIGMVITFWIRSGLYPGAKAKNPFPETTNDMFAIELEKDNVFDKEELQRLLRETNVVEIKQTEF